jgi:xylulokinase
MWLRDHEPEITARTHKYVDTHAYLVYHLTGRWVTSLACADPMGMVDMRRGVWAENLLTELGLDPARLVEIVPAGSVIGPLTPAAAEATGLSAGTHVVAGAGDGQCAGLGANITRPGIAYLNLGTAMVSGAHVDHYVADRAFRTLCSPVAGAFVPEEVLTAGTFTVSWFMEAFGPDVSGLSLAQEDVMEMAAVSVPPGSLGLMVVPYWKGVLPPYWDPAATGVTIGWTEVHRKEHFYRAILEGIGYEHRLVMDGVSRATGQPINEYVLMGGGARSKLWCQIVADIHGKPVSRARTTEATSLGAAILAAAAAGWYPDVRGAADAMTATGQQFEPDSAAHAVYERLFVEVYQQLFPSVRDLVDRLTALTHDREPEA